MAVVPVPLSAAGESAARKSSAQMSSIGGVCTWGTRSTRTGHSDRLSGVTLEWAVIWNTVRIWATLGHSASGYPSRPEYPTQHGRDAHPTYMVSPHSMVCRTAMGGGDSAPTGTLCEGETRANMQSG